jgi:hypothetical protein
MGLSDRLSDLEKRVADGAGCRTCAAAPAVILLRIDPVTGAKPTPPGPCPECGRVPTVIRLRPVRLDNPRATTATIPEDDDEL